MYGRSSGSTDIQSVDRDRRTRPAAGWPPQQHLHQRSRAWERKPRHMAHAV